MKNHVNLLPADIRRRGVLRVRARQWFGVWCAVALVCVVLGWKGFRDLVSARAERDNAELAYRPTRVLVGELTSMRREVESLSRIETTVAELDNPKPILTLLGVVSHAADQCDGRIQIVEFKLGRMDEHGISFDARTPGLEHGLVLRGNSLDLKTPTRFVDALQEANIFAKVNLKDTREEIINGGRLSVFHVECVF